MAITPDFQSGDEVSTTSTRSNGPDANGRSTDLQSDRLGSIPTVSTIWPHIRVIYEWVNDGKLVKHSLILGLERKV